MAATSPQSVCVIITWILVGLVVPGRSQVMASATPPPPSRPYVGTLKGNFTFIKKYTYKTQTATLSAEPPAAQSFPPSLPDELEVDSVQTGTLRKDKVTLVDGTSTETWRVNTLRFSIPSSNPNTVLVGSTVYSYYHDEADFEELAWVNATFFQGEQLLGDKKCYVYKNSDMTAWIDESTKLPLAFDSPQKHIVYIYGTPDSLLQLPPNAAAKLQQMNRSWMGMPTRRE